MNFLLKRRQLIMAALVVVLGAAVFVNWYYTNSGGNIKGGTDGTTGEYVQSLGEAQLVNSEGSTDESTDAVSAADCFAGIRLKRDAAHSEAMDNINGVIESALVSSDLAEKAAQSLDALTASIRTEADIETLVSAKLGCDCVALCSADNVQVLVEGGVLTEDTAVLVRDIVLTKTGVSADAITIVEAK